jgi:hypothetical protein
MLRGGYGGAVAQYVGWVLCTHQCRFSRVKMVGAEHPPYMNWAQVQKPLNGKQQTAMTNQTANGETARTCRGPGLAFFAFCLLLFD